jgi:5-methylthioadenosine/S-adenosylhomocysteine deaminase
VLIGLIQDAGVNIAFGTDNMTEDLFQAMMIGSIVHRTGRGRPVEGGVAQTPQQVLDHITRNGALSLGATADIGCIAPGMKADLTILDLDIPAMRPVIRPVSNIVHYGHPGVVHSVMVDGAFIMRDRKITTIDEKALLAEAQTVTRQVWERMLAANSDIAPADGEPRWLDV